MNSTNLIELANQLDEASLSGGDMALRHVVTTGGEILVEGNREGLLHLASQILRLLSRDYFAGIHQDFDPFAPSDEGSARMTIERIEGIGPT